MVVIVCRVVGPYTANAVVDIDTLQEISIGWELSFFLVVQTIETYILQGSRATGGSKSVGLSSLHGNLTPLGLRNRTCATYGHTALIELLTIAQDILTDFTKVDVEVTTVAGTAFRLHFIGIDERIHQPEFDILDV